MTWKVDLLCSMALAPSLFSVCFPYMLSCPHGRPECPGDGCNRALSGIAGTPKYILQKPRPPADFKGKMLTWWLLTGWISSTEIVWNMELKYGTIRWGTQSKGDQRLVSLYVLICPLASGLASLPAWQCENLLSHLEGSVTFLSFRKWGELTVPFKDHYVHSPINRYCGGKMSFWGRSYFGSI